MALLFGALILARQLDYERTPDYYLTVEARDSGHPPLSSTTVITITVLDANDNVPRFEGSNRRRLTTSTGKTVTNGSALVAAQTEHEDPDSSIDHYYEFTVLENTREGTVIGQVRFS
ncbi:unnamed protein product [Protopolystoma xenopodis]|uniref:Cadherin domain-containing protein n=1 Tax=Protopolystoma xenopodis TaxID=117903 RepID=A0A448WFM6_9PLAT|nr:unnamed protein product [Protopolystoma xenopodis]